MGTLSSLVESYFGILFQVHVRRIFFYALFFFCRPRKKSNHGPIGPFSEFNFRLPPRLPPWLPSGLFVFCSFTAHRRLSTALTPLVSPANYTHGLSTILTPSVFPAHYFRCLPTVLTSSVFPTQYTYWLSTVLTPSVFPTQYTSVCPCSCCTVHDD